MILSGVHNNSSMTSISDPDIFKQLMKKFENKQSAKLLCIVMSCYEVPDKDFKKMLGSVKSDKHVVEAFRKLLN